MRCKQIFPYRLRLPSPPPFCRIFSIPSKSLKMRSASSERREPRTGQNLTVLEPLTRLLPSRLPKYLDALFEATEKATTTPTAQPKGEKTIARIARIEEVLKTRGPSTLKELERILGIDKATMTRLLGKLDMRRYELHSRPGDDREKVLRLKVQIR
jgi:Fic family protein